MKKKTLYQKNIRLLLPVFLGAVFLSMTVFLTFGYLGYFSGVSTSTHEFAQSAAVLLRHELADKEAQDGLIDYLQSLVKATGYREVGFVMQDGGAYSSSGFFAAHDENPGWNAVKQQEPHKVQTRHLGKGLWTLYCVVPVYQQSEQLGWLYAIREQDIADGFWQQQRSLLKEYFFVVLAAALAGAVILYLFRIRLQQGIQLPIQKALERVRAIAEGVTDTPLAEENDIAELDVVQKLFQKTTERMREINRVNLTYRKSIDILNTVVYEYNLQSKDFKILAGDTRPITGMPAPQTFREAARQLMGAVHPKDKDLVKRAFGWDKSDVAAREYFAELEYRMITYEGHLLWAKGFQTCHKNAEGMAVSVVGSITDITEQKLIEKNLEKQAQRDSLTKLYNKQNFTKMAANYLEQEGAGRLNALIVLDIDNFKQINDTYGHSMGDKILTQFAQQFKMGYQQGDIFGRIGGDEFAVLLKDIRTIDGISPRIDEFIKTVGRKIKIDAGHQLSVSAGLAIYPRDGMDYETLFDRADEALYRAKSLGKNRCCGGELSSPFSQGE